MNTGMMMSASRLQLPGQSASFRKCNLPSQPRARFAARAGPDSDTPPATESIGNTLSALDMLVKAPDAKPDLAAMKVAEIRRNTGPAVMPQGIGASATNASAAKPAAAAKQSKAALTTEDIIGYAERLNGRFGMLGFVALVANEVRTGDNFWGQLASGGGGSALLVIIAVLAASFAPYVTGSVDVRTALNDVEPKREFGPFRYAFELSAGRAAMMGLAGTAALELIMSGPFFQ